MNHTPTTAKPLCAAITATLSVRNGRAAVDFYKTALGATELYRVEDGGALVAQLSVEGAEFWVADESPEHEAFSPETLGGGTVKLLLVVDEPQAVIDRAVGLGARQVYAAESQHGWMLGRIEDPFGHHWEIGKPLGPWPPRVTHHG